MNNYDDFMKLRNSIEILLQGAFYPKQIVTCQGVSEGIINNVIEPLRNGVAHDTIFKLCEEWNKMVKGED